MRNKIHLVTLTLAIFLCSNYSNAQVDFSKTPSEELGTIENLFQEHFFEALKQKGIENYGRAVEALLKCLEIEDNKAIVHFELGKNYKQIKNYEAAALSLNKGLTMKPNDEWILAELCEVYTLKNDIENAIETAKQLAASHPKRKHKLAKLYHQIGENDKALKLLDELEADFGLNRESDSLKRRIQRQTGQGKAHRVTFLKKGNKESPKDEQEFLALIYKYSESGDTKKTFKTAKDLLEKYPDSQLVHLALYKFYEDNGDTKNAIKSMHKVIKGDKIPPESKAKVLNEFIKFVDKNPEYKSHLVDAIKTVESAPDNSVSSESIGDYYYKLGDKTKALKHYENALKNDTNNFKLIKRVLFLKIDTDQNKSAAIHSKEAIELYPSNPILYLINGVANNNIKQPETAIESLEIGLDYIVDDLQMEADFYKQFEKAYRLENKLKKAEMYLKKHQEILKKIK